MDLAVVFGVVIFLGALQTLNYEVPIKKIITIDETGFSNSEISLPKNSIVLIDNLLNESITLKINNVNQELKPYHKLQFKTLTKGEVHMQIINRNCIDCNLKILID